MKKEDILVLACIRQDARAGLTKISRATSIPITTIYHKLKSFEKNFIKKYTTIIDFPKLGYNTRAMILIRTKRDMKEKLFEYLINNKSLNSLYKINNGYDFMMEIIAREIREVETFVDYLETTYGLEKKEIHYLIEEVNREEFMGNIEYLRLVENTT